MMVLKAMVTSMSAMGGVGALHASVLMENYALLAVGVGLAAASVMQAMGFRSGSGPGRT